MGPIPQLLLFLPQWGHSSTSCEIFCPQVRHFPIPLYKEDGKKAIDHKSKKEELLNYFSEVLPDYDEERVYPSNIKKILQWYNTLVDVKFDFNSLEEKEEEEKEKN